MQPRSLDQIITELNSTYDPQVKLIQQQQSAIPGQLQADEQGLQAKQTQAYDDIVQGARRRGTGVAFGGIPLQEQAKYSATEYMPALAKLRQGAQQQALSLQDALNQIYEKRNSFANQLKQNEDQLFESRRQFDANMAFQKEQEANRLRQAAAASAASFSPSLGGASFGGGQPQQQAPAQAGSVNPMQQDAYNEVRTRMQKMNDAQLKSDYAATMKSASYGNQRDKYKVEFYTQLRPDLFKTVSAGVLGNGGALRF